MSIQNVDIISESRTRYLTYALSVVTSRAIPDVRDGLKPVQRRILYAMLHNLGLTPQKGFRKSAAVVGEVLGRYHPHGDAACYEAMVRMAQEFSLRYALVEGQGNFGSLDGDSAAAYRYTEAKLKDMAIELLGDIDFETVSFRDNFDQTTQEPVVLPTRVPNLLMNGASGIAVGMATSIPPHNLNEIADALVTLIEKPDVTTTDLLKCIKGPDFPTRCEILNSKNELKDIYESGRGSIRMRATYKVELDKPKGARVAKKLVVFDSIPYGIDKSTIVEKIADVVVSKKITQVEDVRDESTEVVRIVIEMTQEADEEKILAYLFKATPLQSNFPVNLTVLLPDVNSSQADKCIPAQVGLKQILNEFNTFRIEVHTKKLNYLKRKLEERIHVLEGLELIIDKLDAVIKEVRKSSSRSDAIERLCDVFRLTKLQSEFVVDLRVYQLTKTNLEEVISELEDKRKEVSKILKILGNPTLLKKEIINDLMRIKEAYGDKRRSKIISDYDALEVSEVDLIQDEEVYVILTKDGWLKRIKSTNDPSVTRLRDGDSIFFSSVASSKDHLLIFTSHGNAYATQVYNLSSTSGYGEPFQKLFKCNDGETVAAAMILHAHDAESNREYLLYSKQGMGFVTKVADCMSLKKSGKRVMRLKEGDSLQGLSLVQGDLCYFITQAGYCLALHKSEIPVLSAGAKGVQLIKVSGSDFLVSSVYKSKKAEILLVNAKGEVPVSAATFSIGKRATKGEKIPVQKLGQIISAK